MTTNIPYIEVTKASKRYQQRDSQGNLTTIAALKNIDLTIQRGETLGLVGESGSGKTTLGRAILNLLHLDEGQILVNGASIDDPANKENFQVVFQDPYSSLNPYFTALQIVMEPISHLSAKERKQKASDILSKVGISESEQSKRPKAFSGGQRQRIGIARAIVNNPQFIVLDEPTSALDVSIQAQILDLLDDIQREMGLSYLFISHDLGVVRHISDRIAVMYRGQLVEVGSTEAIFNDARHPYTQQLLASLLPLNPKQAREQLVQDTAHSEITLSEQYHWEDVDSDHRVRIDD
ncbi:MAG: ATP-binding cassette domain-containing protein [Aerococcus sp.]|nr:ATP-binding cassette domain-containing protein [Aerococcus sp.]